MWDDSENATKTKMIIWYGDENMNDYSEHAVMINKSTRSWYSVYGHVMFENTNLSQQFHYVKISDYVNLPTKVDSVFQ